MEDGIFQIIHRGIALTSAHLISIISTTTEDFAAQHFEANKKKKKKNVQNFFTTLLN